MNNIRQPIPILQLKDIPLEPVPVPLPEKPSLASRVGDVMQIADALRMSLELADLAVKLLEQSGVNPYSASQIRKQLLMLRGSL